MILSLIAHPDTPPSGPLAIDVDIVREAGQLRLRYLLSGEVDRVLLPASAPGMRKDGLWQTTCFEAFLRKPGEAAYCELNFSPSTDWAAYAFTGYREGMRELALTPTVRRDDAGLTATIDLDAGIWSLAVTAVIEETDGTKSYWSIAHPPGRPDFHHPDCFVVDLAAPPAP